MAHGATRPTVSRRREIGGASARSLLMTILGEFVLPRGGSVWTQVLVSTLALFGVVSALMVLTQMVKWPGNPEPVEAVA